MTSKSLKEQVVNSMSWTGLSQLVTQSIHFLTTIVLARLLLPDDFGVVALALLFTGFVFMLGEVGLGAALIQKQDVDDADLSTVFWMGLIIGVVLWAASTLISPIAASLLRNKALEQIITVSSVSFILNSLGAVQKVLLNKHLKFNRLAIVEVSSMTIYGVASIALALGGLSYWSLVIGSICKSASEVLLLWIVNNWRPLLLFDKNSFKKLFGFGFSVWGFNLINYARENIDNLVVGRLLSASALGYYALSYNLSNLPRRQLASIVGRVSYPAFAKIQYDDERLRRGYFKIIRYISLISFPALTGLAILAPELIPYMYGDKWTPAIIPLQILCGAGMLYSLGTTTGSLYMAKGRPDLQFKISIAALIALSFLVYLGAGYGINGVAAAVLLYTLSSLLIGQAIANSLIGLRMTTYLWAVVPACLGTSVMLATLLGYRYVALLVYELPDFLWISTAILIGAVTYLLVLWLLRIEESRESLRLVRQQYFSLVLHVKSIRTTLTAGYATKKDSLGDAR